MGFEKFGLLILLNYLNQLGEVKNHLQLALREVLLAMQSSLEIVGKSTNNTALSGSKDFIDPFLGPVQKILSYTIEKVNPEQTTDEEIQKIGNTMQLKDHIVQSIISAIDDEIVNTKGTTSEKNKLKVEALNTVKQVLIQQKKKPFPFKANSKAPKSNVA